MVFYNCSQYINNYTLRYLSNKSLIAKNKMLPKITSLTVRIRYNPHRYDYPYTYINDFIFIWYMYTNIQFINFKHFLEFSQILKNKKSTHIKQLYLSQTHFNSNNIITFFQTLNQLITKNVIKDVLFSTYDTFLIQNKKTNFITYNSTNNSNFIIPINNINFEQITQRYNFILNPVDFYTDFKIMLSIKTQNVNAYHTAWLLNLIKFNYFFTAEHYVYNKYTR